MAGCSANHNSGDQQDYAQRDQPHRVEPPLPDAKVGRDSGWWRPTRVRVKAIVGGREFTFENIAQIGHIGPPGETRALKLDLCFDIKQCAGRHLGAACRVNVRFGSKADIRSATRHVRFTPNSDLESEIPQKAKSALPPKADMCGAKADVRYVPKADMRCSPSETTQARRGCQRRELAGRDVK